MTALVIAPAYTDVVCPPDPNAVCGRCGEALMFHINPDDPHGPITPAVGVCLDSAALRRRKIQYLRFQLADGETLDCANAGEDPVCGAELCSEHTDEFFTCAGNSAVLHHPECRHGCRDCADVRHAA